jgi:3-hydroxybutyryl-CoA dehydrogenase
MAEVLEDFALRRKSRKKGTIKKVGIIGCGSMGQDIARTVSQYGMDVVFIDVSDERIKQIYLELESSLDEIINRWGLTKSDKRAILSRIQGSTNYEDLKECDIVIETINFVRPGTSIEIRKRIFRDVEKVVSKETIITSNTSTLSISDLSSTLEHPERAVGLHFIVPASSVDIVEVIKGVRTSQASLDHVIKFARMIGKRIVTTNESPGNISTRMIVSLINEACEVLMEGVAPATCIDVTMKRGFGLQFGPFELADRIGLDKLIKWMENLHTEFGDQKYKPNPIIKRLYRANMLGRKTEAGFYKYKDGKIVGETIHCPEFK